MFDEIKGIILDQLDLEENEIKLESKLIEDLGADSLDILEIMSAIEEKFSIEITKADAEKIKTIQDLINYLEKK